MSCDVMLKATDVAKLVQVSVRTIWRWRSEGRIPEPLEIEGSIRWNPDKVQQWIAEGCQNLAERQNADRRS